MRNRRHTLAFPPYSISPQSSQRVGANSWKELEEDLEDWLSFDRFLPLSSKQKSPTVAFGLPKHSQLSDLDRVERLRHYNLPPVATVDSNSIAIGNLPIHFSWSSKLDTALGGGDVQKSIEQIVQELQPLVMRTKVSPPPLLSSEARRNIESVVRVKNVGKKMKWAKAEENEKLGGPTQLGPPIEDLFTHSYSPPPSRSRSHSHIAKSASSWV